MPPAPCDCRTRGAGWCGTSCGREPGRPPSREFPDEAPLGGIERVVLPAAIGLPCAGSGADHRFRCGQRRQFPGRATAGPSSAPGSGPTAHAGSNRTMPSRASPGPPPAPPSRPETARHRGSAAARHAEDSSGAVAWRAGARHPRTRPRSSPMVVPRVPRAAPQQKPRAPTVVHVADGRSPPVCGYGAPGEGPQAAAWGQTAEAGRPRA